MMRVRSRAHSLLEVIVAISLLALVFPLLLNLIPSGRLVSYRAELIQTATCGAETWLEYARTNPIPRDDEVTINNVTYHATTEIWPLPNSSICDVVVTFTPPRGAPVVLSSRVSILDP